MVGRADRHRRYWRWLTLGVGVWTNLVQRNYDVRHQTAFGFCSRLYVWRFVYIFRRKKKTTELLFPALQWSAKSFFANWQSPVSRKQAHIFSLVHILEINKYIYFWRKLKLHHKCTFFFSIKTKHRAAKRVLRYSMKVKAGFLRRH